IAFCADAHRTRATSGQGRAYSAARDDIPDRTALFANNWRARCTISKLTLHSKNAGEWAESQLKVHSQQDIHLYFCSTSHSTKKPHPFESKAAFRTLSLRCVNSQVVIRFRRRGGAAASPSPRASAGVTLA